MTSSTYRLGFDIGGTFTDFVLTESTTGATILGKCLTTPHAPAEGVSAGLEALLSSAGIENGREIEIAIHATTLITNALIERKGSIVALLTTEGFSDTLEMGTELRYDNYDLSMRMPKPLVPRQLRFGISERLDRDGEIVVPLDEMAVRRLAAKLRAARVAAVAIVFLHSFRNPIHEQRASSILREEIPDLLVSCSSVVSPEIREFERTSTTVANAYVQPIVQDYLDKALESLKHRGYRNALYMMISSGGISTGPTIKQLPLRMLESGPTAGVLAAAKYSRMLGLPDLITFDMGGTTAKIGLIKNHEARKGSLFEVARVSRFRKGSGIPIRLPHIELIEIGAGGGSIASVDPLGLLAVGPQSAGSEPGPACYGRGGMRATVTDADLILGYLNPTYFLGGAMPLSIDASRAAFEGELCPALELSIDECARGVFEVVNQNMLAASKVHIAERSEDPRNFYLFAFGGAGPAHAYELARALRAKGVIVPPAAGAASAWGLVSSPASFDVARTLLARLDQVDWQIVADTFCDMADEAISTLSEAGVGQATVRHFMDLRHLGQGREVTIEVTSSITLSNPAEEIARSFYQAHAQRFGHVHQFLPVELVTCRTSACGPDVSVSLRHLPDPAQTAEALAPKSMRQVYFPEVQGHVETPVYERSKLRVGTTLWGPAIIEERECTTVAGPSAFVRIDRSGSIFLEVAEVTTQS